MARFTLTKEQVTEIVFENRIKLSDSLVLIHTSSEVLIDKTAETYGFKVVTDKVKKIVTALNIREIGKDKKYEGAVLQVRGEYSVKPDFAMNVGGVYVKGEFFIFHESQNAKLLKDLSEKLVKENAVKLFPGCDTEYLYETLSEVSETEFYETFKKTSPGLPIYHIDFDNDGNFKINELGIV